MAQRFSSLVVFCLFIALLFSLVGGGAHWNHDVSEGSNIELVLDADDVSDVTALLQKTAALPYVSSRPVFSWPSSRQIVRGCFSPPDRPPAGFA